MTWDQGAILAVLGCTLALFVWDRWRYDVVAITSLMVCVVLGLVDPGGGVRRVQQPGGDHGGGGAGDQSRAGPVGRDRRARRQGARRQPLAACALGLFRHPRRPAFRLHEQCRRARAVAAGRPVDCPTQRLRARISPDAVVVRHAARRHDHPDRDAAKSPDFGVPGGGDGAALPAVRLRADGSCSEHRRHRLPPPDWLALPAGGRRARSGRARLRGRGLRDRGPSAARLPAGRGRGRPARRGARRHRARCRPRRPPGVRPSAGGDAAGARHPAAPGRYRRPRAPPRGQRAGAGRARPEVLGGRSESSASWRP